MLCNNKRRGLRRRARQRGCHRRWLCAARKIIGLEAFWIVAHLFATELDNVWRTGSVINLKLEMCFFQHYWIMDVRDSWLRR